MSCQDNDCIGVTEGSAAGFYLSHEDIGECCKRKGEMAKSQQNMPSSNESFAVRLPMQMCRENFQVGAKEGITPKLTSIQPGGGWH